jgi:hypothetical protein
MDMDCRLHSQGSDEASPNTQDGVHLHAGQNVCATADHAAHAESNPHDAAMPSSIVTTGPHYEDKALQEAVTEGAAAVRPACDAVTAS